MATGSRLCSAIIFLVSSGRSDSRIRLSHLAKAIRLRSIGAPSVSAIVYPLLERAIAGSATAIAKILTEVTRKASGKFPERRRSEGALRHAFNRHLQRDRSGEGKGHANMRLLLMEKADAPDAPRIIARRVLLSADSTSPASRIGGHPSDGHSATALSRRHESAGGLVRRSVRSDGILQPAVSVYPDCRTPHTEM